MQRSSSALSGVAKLSGNMLGNHNKKLLSQEPNNVTFPDSLSFAANMADIASVIKNKNNFVLFSKRCCQLTG